MHTHATPLENNVEASPVRPVAYPTTQSLRFHRDECICSPAVLGLTATEQVQLHIHTSYLTTSTMSDLPLCPETQIHLQMQH